MSVEKDVVAAKVDGVLVDLARKPAGKGELITRTSAEGINIVRHSTAHVLAEAVQELFPGTQAAIGPVIENGFYYDFLRDTPFSSDDLSAIEKKMHEIVKRKEALHREEWTREQAIAFFEERGDRLKVELIRDIPEGQTISVYRNGNFVDLCRGPHVPSTEAIGNGFHLTKVSGSYWRGDAKGQPLQRIYGTAWATKKELDDYLLMIEEAEKRNHVRIGKEMDLFHLQEEAPGSVFWHPRGWTLYRILVAFIREKIEKNGYQEVNTPQLVSRRLWEMSGHWDKFRDNMFCLKEGDHDFAIKPMNCPCHVELFKQGMKSYRDLPLRIAEFGSCIRNEPSGSLSGTMRVRAFTQDDAHIFCTPEQIVDETKAFCCLLMDVYADLGFTDVLVRLSTRPEKRLGTDEDWDRVEKALDSAAKASGLMCIHCPGEGAFYGPKLEFVLKDALGRPWQCGTFQVDPFLPERLGARYIGSDGHPHTPIMLHRVILGTFERFIGVLIEHYAGHLPVWLAPVQVAVATISERSEDYAKRVVETMKEKGLRVIGDFRNEKISRKIKEHSLQKVPYIFVIGEKEAQTESVSVRCKNEESVMPLAQACALVRKKNDKKGLAALS